MKAKITNYAPRRRRGWVDIAVPQALVTGIDTFVFGPKRWPVARGIDVGIHSTLLHVFCELGPNETVHGEFTAAEWEVPFGVTQWVADDIRALVPSPTVLESIDDYDNVSKEHTLEINASKLEMVEENMARIVWHQQGRIPDTMFVWDAWHYFYSHQDAVPIEWMLTCSDPTVTDLQQHIAGLYVDIGEYTHLDFKTRLGITDAVGVAGPQWRQVLSAHRTHGDAEQMLWTGTMGALPTRGTAAPGPAGWNDEALRLDSLIAHTEGPILGLCTQWDGHWLAFDKVPTSTIASPFHNHDRFNSLLENWGDMYDARPIGMTKSTANAGGREDFGSTKGAAAVTLQDPYWLHIAKYSMSDYMRPFHYREADGSRVMKANHPEWTTWSQGSWARGGGTHDILGKVANSEGYIPKHSGSQFGGMDDQHRSTNNFAALYALTGSYAMKSCMEDMLQVDLAQVPGRMGAARAVGRLFLSWSNMIMLLDHSLSMELTAHMSTRMDVLLEQWQGQDIDPDKPIRVLELGSDPSLLDEDGKRILAWIVWQHGLLCIGLKAAWQVTGDTKYQDMLNIFAHLVTRHGTFVQNGTQQSIAALRYLLGDEEGDRLPESSYRIDSKDIQIPPWTFWTNVLPAIIIAEQLGDDVHAPPIIKNVIPNGPRTWPEAEWYAI